MTSYFFDSSALVKRYLIETGSKWVISQVAKSSGHQVYISVITQVEIISAVARSKREGHISPRTAQAIRLVLQRHLKREYGLFQLNDRVVTRAQNLLETYPLRAYDAVQLASALELHTNLIRGSYHGLTFVSSDTRLITVAIQEGLSTDNPNNYP